MKKIIVLTFSLFLLLIVYLYFNKKNSNAIINPIQNDRVAYYVDNGNDGYDKQNTIPIGNYVINEEKSKCLAGGTISNYNRTNGTIQYTLYGADKCSVYFDVKLPAPATVNMGTVAISETGGSQNISITLMDNSLAYKLLSDNNTTYSTTTNSGLVKDILYGNMFRYQSNVDRTCSVESDTCKNNDGTYFNTEDNTNNYVCFGYSNISDCAGANSDDYLYRIIGIDKDSKEVQVIKATGIKEGSTTYFRYHFLNRLTDWGAGMTNTQADISKRLNGTHTTLSNIFVNSTQYPYMAENSTWYNKISNHNWKSGELAADSSTTTCSNSCGTGTTAYNAEARLRTTPPMKIGLLNNSDVLWAFTGGNPGRGSVNRNSWLYSDVGAANSYEWTSLLNWSDSAWHMSGDRRSLGNLDSEFVIAEHCVRPAFFLNVGISWTSGSGTPSDPFIVA